MCRTCGPRFISPSTLLNPRQSLASHWSKFQSQAKAWHLKLDYRLHRYTYPLLCICICIYNCVYIHVHTNIPCSVLTSQNVTSVSTIILQTYWKKCFPYFLIKYSLACVFWSDAFSCFWFWQRATLSLFDFPQMIKLPSLHTKCLTPPPPPACTNFHNVTEETMNNFTKFSLLRAHMLLATKNSTLKKL